MYVCVSMYVRIYLYVYLPDHLIMCVLNGCAPVIRRRTDRLLIKPGGGPVVVAGMINQVIRGRRQPG